MKREILDRTDITFLVRTFYVEVRKDEMIGHFFNDMIREENWEHHFEVITDFWETNLLNKKSYRGRPDSIHLWVDLQTGRKITQMDFDRWLELWISTIDKYFTGEIANTAKERAKMIAKSLFSKMLKVRKIAKDQLR